SGACESTNPESRDSPMRNCASEVWSFRPSRNDGVWSRRDDAASSVARPAARQELPLDLGGGKRPAEQKTLHLRASFGSDAVELLRGFHTLGGGRHAHAIGERGNRPHDVERARILGDVLDEGTVDLDL